MKQIHKTGVTMDQFGQGKKYVLTIINWELYNPRGDLKYPSWFRLNHDFFENPNFWDFSNDERLVWICLLCMVSKANLGGKLLIFANLCQSLSKSSNTSAEVCQSTILKLQQNRIVKINIFRSVQNLASSRTESGPYGDGDVNVNERNKKAHLKKKPNEQIGYSDSFLKSYFLYPRKEGKKRGWLSFQKQLKQNPDLEEKLIKSVNNYNLWIQEKKTKPEFIKHFSTFMNEWEDWFDFYDENNKPNIPKLAGLL